MEISIIVAAGKEGEIGRRGDLIWKISEDLKRFKKLTMGHPVIMGRKTWESLPKRPLPGRQNIVLSRNTSYKTDGAQVTDTASAALLLAGGADPFIMGGAEIYNLFLPLADTIFLTEIDGCCPDADAYLQIDGEKWERTDQSEWRITPDGVRYRYVELKRKSREE